MKTVILIHKANKNVNQVDPVYAKKWKKGGEIFRRLGFRPRSWRLRRSLLTFAFYLLSLKLFQARET